MKTYTVFLLILVTLLHETNTKIHHHHKRHKVITNTLNTRNDILQTSQVTSKSGKKLILTDKTNKDQLPETAAESNDEDATNDSNNYKVVGTAFVNPSVGNKVVEPIGYDATGMNYHQTQDEREMEKRPVSNSESFNDENEFVKDSAPSSPFSNSDTDADQKDMIEKVINQHDGNTGIDTGADDTDDGTTSAIEKVVKKHISSDKADNEKNAENDEEFDLQERATQHDHISASDKKIIDSEDPTVIGDTQQQLTKAIQHDHISDKTENEDSTMTYDDLKQHLQQKASPYDNINGKADEIAENAVSESFDEKPGMKIYSIPCYAVYLLIKL